jgi:hypothetical protein
LAGVLCSSLTLEITSLYKKQQILVAGNLVKYNVKKTRERRKLNEKPSKKVL